jgi:hypothetical protein
MKWNVEAWSHYPLTLIFGTVLILLTCHALYSRSRQMNKPLVLIAWGLTVGLGWWTNYLIIAYVLPAGYLLWVNDKKCFLRMPFLSAWGSLIVGALPFLLFNQAQGWPIFKVA